MTTSDVEQNEDADGDWLEAIFKAGFLTLAVMLCAPLIIPFIVRATTAVWAPTKRWYWITYKWWWVIVTTGIVLLAALLAVEVLLAVQWARAGGYDALVTTDDRIAIAWGAVWPWLIVNTAAGVLLVPAMWSAQRRKVAEKVRHRTIPDVVRQERIEAARRQAMDMASARRIGVKVDAVTKQITGSTGKGIVAPYAVGDGQYALGVINRDTIQSIAQKTADRSRVPDWVTADSRYLILPTKAGACRMLLFSESGTGKTVWLMSMIAAAALMGTKVIFIDAKGVPRDARETADLVRHLGRTAVISGKGPEAATRWNLFNGSAADVTAKLMRLQPPPDGANQHYLEEIEAVLTALQHAEPLRSVADLHARLARLDARDKYDFRMLQRIVNTTTKETAAERAIASVVKSLRRFEGWIDNEGWTFDAPEADVTICPLIPVDPTQAALGDLLLLELRSYIARRLTNEDYSPVLVIVDEFPQLVTPGNDPADLAARLFETIRSAGGGLILAGQNVEGFSPEPAMRARALNSGAAVAFGRQKSPDELCALAGTELRLEASGAATGEELKSGRAQHSYQIKPQDVRTAAAAQFWIVQGGSHAAFRALPNARADVTSTPAAVGATSTDRDDEPHEENETPQEEEHD